jgi:hypothetical protein
MSALRTVLGASIVILVACGGSSSSVNGGDSGPAASSSSGGSSSGASGSGGSSGGASSSGAGDDSSVASGDDSGLPGVGADGSVDIPPDLDAAAPRDAGGGVTTPPRGTDGGPGQIACGATPCDSATQVCCVGGGGGGRTCTSAAGCMGETLACTGTNSCPAGICCLQAAAGRGNAVTSKCEAMCPGGAQQLCTTNADCATDAVCRRLSATISVCERAPMPPIRDGGVIFRGDAGH